LADDPARLFVALWPGAAVRRALVAWCPPAQGGTGAKPVASTQWHLTLHFLGNVARERVPALRDALGVPFAGFRLVFSRCESWPRGLLVAAPDAVPPALIELHGALATAITRFGLAVETRPFRPHITLARKHAGAVPPPAGATLAWDVDSYALVESRLRTGAGYSVLHDYAASVPPPVR
jgi:2'-5' RNA ligase